MTNRGSNPGITGTAFAEVSRWASEDGQSALVQTTESLTGQDLNAARDEYLWRSGDLHLIPGTTLPGVPGVEQLPPVLSHDGGQVAFTAYRPLLPSDGDTALDIYVARSGGGFEFPQVAPGCSGEACRPASLAPPGEQSSASESTSSRGNVRPAATKPKKGKARCPRGKRRVNRNGKARCMTVKTRSKKATAKKQRRANRNQGGQK